MYYGVISLNWIILCINHVVLPQTVNEQQKIIMKITFKAKHALGSCFLSNPRWHHFVSFMIIFIFGSLHFAIVYIKTATRQPVFFKLNCSVPIKLRLQESKSPGYCLSRGTQHVTFTQTNGHKFSPHFWSPAGREGKN